VSNTIGDPQDFLLDVQRRESEQGRDAALIWAYGFVDRVRDVAAHLGKEAAATGKDLPDALLTESGYGKYLDGIPQSADMLEASANAYEEALQTAGYNRS
jgi:hypothetical protein